MTPKTRAVAPRSAPTEKGGRTRERILEAAVRLFAERGYDGAGIRDVEQAAGVNRGLTTYHFGNKKDLWKAAFDFTFLPYLEELRSKSDLIRALDSETRARFLIERFVRTSAERPYMNRLMVQENFSKSWRSEWIVERFLLPARELNGLIADDDPALRRLESDPNLRYALLGACNMVFSHPCEVQALFNQDVYDEEFIQKHVSTILDLFGNWLAAASIKKGKLHV